MQPAARATNDNRFVYAALLALFVFTAALAALKKDVTRGFDELAHASFVAELQSTGAFWPPLARLRMLDPRDFRFTGQANYLNHPPLFYAALAAIGPRLENRPHAIFWHRAINVAIGAAALAAALALGLAMRLTKTEFLAYGVPLFAIPALIPLVGSVNNDNLAFAGSALAIAAAYGLLRSGRTPWLVAMLAGVVMASAAKLTGLLLAGGFAGAVLSYLLWKRRFRAAWAPAVAAALLVAAAPYLAFILQYGSPAPDTAAQLAMLKEGAQAAGWADAPRLRFSAYAAWFAASFFAEWMPTLAPRSAFHYAMLALPLAALLCSLAGCWIAARRFAQGREGPAETLVLAGFAALAATFAIHLWFSYGRHVETGWMMDAYPRYYFPLVAILPLASVLLLREIERPRLRLALAVFLVAGPLLFRLLGGPIVPQF